jgi:hypothetical protein
MEVVPYDVRPEQYATVIRELLRHENDLTNHRIIWLLIVQGFLANAYVIVKANSDAGNAIALSAVVIDLSALVVLHKSYRARGYLRFLGTVAKRGELREKYLPLDGWPIKRIKGWQAESWFNCWLERPSHVLEPYILLPVFSMSIWICALLNRWSPLPPMVDFGVVFLFAVAMISVLLTLLVRWERGHEEDSPEKELGEM